MFSKARVDMGRDALIVLSLEKGLIKWAHRKGEKAKAWVELTHLARDYCNKKGL